MKIGTLRNNTCSNNRLSICLFVYFMYHDKKQNKQQQSGFFLVFTSLLQKQINKMCNVIWLRVWPFFGKSVFLFCFFFCFYFANNWIYFWLRNANCGLPILARLDQSPARIRLSEIYLFGQKDVGQKVTKGLTGKTFIPVNIFS